MIQHRPPAGEIELALDQPGQPVVGGPAVEEITVLGHALAEGGQIAGHQARARRRQVHGVHLVAAVAAVLLPLAAHAVHQRFLGAVVQGIDGGVKEALEGRLAGAEVWLYWAREKRAAARAHR